MPRTEPRPRIRQLTIPELLETNSSSLNAMLAKLHGWTEEQIGMSEQLAEARNEFRRLPRKDSFSGWAVTDKIERLESRGAQPLPPFWSCRNACATVRSMRINTPELQRTYVRYLKATLDRAEQHRISMGGTAKRLVPDYELADAGPKFQTIALILTLR